jgi:hypothetical protein
MIGCGGGPSSSSGGTAAGTYQVMVTAQYTPSGASQVTQTQAFTLTVQ